MKLTFVGVFVLGLVAASRVLAWPVPTTEEARLDEGLASFTRALCFSRCINPTPSSLGREKALFFGALKAGTYREPCFEYEPVPVEAIRLRPALADLPAGRGPYGVLLARSREEVLAKLALLEARGTPDFPRLAARLQPLPDPDLVRAAKDLLREPVLDDGGPLISSPAMAELLRKALVECGLDDWRVLVTPRVGARASVLPQSRVVKVREGCLFTAEDGVRLVRHEVGVHAVRARSGSRAPLRLFTVGLAGYLATEEGLAALNEVRHGVRSGLRLFALRVLAVHWAATWSFSRVFRLLLLCGANEATAWDVTVRAKRGLTDTGEPGTWPKDAVYLRGYLAVSEHLARGGSWDELMSLGKVGLADLPALRSLAGTQPGP